MRLAEATPDSAIVVRGKNADWTRLMDDGLVAAALWPHPQVSADTNYEEPYRSYRLCAAADVIVAKHTSLGDEWLSLGRPVLFHDYMHNTRRLLSGLYDYLPDRLWVHSDAELHERVDWVLADGGADFRAWWEPHRRRIYGDWNDGQVRARLRRHVLALLQGRQ